MNSKIDLKLTLVIVLLWALPSMSTDIYLPSLPAMSHDFNASLAQIQYTIFFYTLGFSCGALFLGPLSDRVGRKPVILISLALAVISSVIAVFAPWLGLLYWARLLQGVAMAGLSSAIRALTRDLCPSLSEMARFGAILGVVIPVASSIAPIVGGYIEKYTSWQLSFVFLLVYAAGFLGYSYKYLAETNLNTEPKPLYYLFSDYYAVIKNFRFLAYGLLSAFAVCVSYTYLTVSSEIMQLKIGLSPEQFGYSNLLISLATIVSSYVNTKLITKRSLDKVLAYGMRLITIAGIAFLLIGVLNLVTLWGTLLAMVILISGCGLIYSNASASSLSLFSKSAGTAAAVYAFLQMLGGTLGSGLISVLSQYANTISVMGIVVILVGISGLKICHKLYTLD